MKLRLPDSRVVVGCLSKFDSHRFCGSREQAFGETDRCMRWRRHNLFFICVNANMQKRIKITKVTKIVLQHTLPNFLFWNPAISNFF